MNGEDDVILPVRKGDSIESRRADAGFAHAGVAHFDDADAGAAVRIHEVHVVASFAAADEAVAADCGARTHALTRAGVTHFDDAGAGATIVVSCVAIIACFHADACSVAASCSTRSSASARARVSSFGTAVGSTTIAGRRVTVITGLAACLEAVATERGKRDLELVRSDCRVIAKFVHAHEIRSRGQVASS